MKVPFKKFRLLIAFFSLTVVMSCDKTDNDFNIFTIEDDKALGAQLEAEIAADPATYPLLDRSQHAAAYEHLDRIVNNLLNSDKVVHKDDFDWSVYLVHDDNTLNAFAGPGGKIYVYTGIIKYLNSEHELAGVLGHEIAHADRRHVTDQLTKAYGVSFLLDIILGQDRTVLADVAAQLAFLRFSRDDERDADNQSVVYLCPTEYKANGAAAFFEKLVNSGQAGGGPVFLSTHPDPGNRVEDINAKANEANCPGDGTFDQRYAEFKAALPG